MKKFTSLLLALVLVISLSVVFTGCGSQSNTPGENGGENNSSKKVLTMATNPNFPPYEFVDDNGKVVGIDAEIAALIAEKIGMELKIQEMDFESCIPAVQAGTADVVLAGLTVTEERKESVNFSDSYSKGVQVIVVKEGSDIKTVNDLEGKTIGVQTATTGDIYCTDQFGQDHVKQFTLASAAIAAVLSGQIDCVVIDNEPAKNFVAANKGLIILDTEYTVEDYAIAVGKENTELLENINKALAELKEEGKIDEILNKYIKAD